MPVVAIGSVSGNDAEILCKCLVLAAIANGRAVTVLGVTGTRAIDLPFVWPEGRSVQHLSCGREDVAEQLQMGIADGPDAPVIFLDCSLEMLVECADVWAIVDFLLVPLNPGETILKAALPFLTRLLALEYADGRSVSRIHLIDATASPRSAERLRSALVRIADQSDRHLCQDLLGILVSSFRTPTWPELDDIVSLAPPKGVNAAVEGIADLWHRLALMLDRSGGRSDDQMQVPPVKPIEHLADQLVALADDVRLIDLGFGPTARELAAAGGLDDWRVADSGQVEGRIVSSDGTEIEKMAPTRVFRVDPNGGWIRTSRQLLRLLKPAYPRASAI